ncbi:MAG: hypothetical protein KIH08_07800 [Candidatus Freyarchaeota archaeon]|nr:hypothetical protein [Candidatus Jordarchaeia archaeon]MBS7269522.1 hypothetical protein [Candidatus Jordarchaeia archaeon]MBS7280293.1 hypothetical protein [Candidatus Jordarchaeia archaeon]
MLESTEKVVNENFDPEILAMFIKEAVRVIGDLFGQAFVKSILNYALEMESEKIGEKKPEDINNIDEAFEYLKEHRDKYPNFFNCFIYGIAKAEKMFEGATASGAKNLAQTAIRKIIDSSGLLSEVKGKISNIYEALLRYIEIVDVVRATTPQRIVNQSEKVIFQEITGDCPWKDGCIAMEKEGITRMSGGPECVVLITNSAAVSLISGKLVDYKLDKFNRPNCQGRIFEI